MLFGILLCSINLTEANQVTLPIKTSYRNIKEFAYYNCIPCHYNNSGTNLLEIFKNMSDREIYDFIDRSLKTRQMPPEENLRQVLIKKLKLLNTLPSK
ncbi:MAG: hypothetical protein D6726_10185 [Nitrospirae bacterium]|nr:MAG: hypothetical protein D6726_10185 [Nitrospirota bacterium]